jgi:DNA polymerase (family X)
MSAETKRYPRAEAIAVAKVVCDALKPVCEPDRLIVAGSLRRRKETVKDVEILYVGRTQQEADPNDMFAQVTVNLADRVIEQLVADGVLARRLNVMGREAWGPKNKLAVHVASGISVDLFSATMENWFNYLVCRTGPAESNTRIATRAQSMGWKWNPYGAGFSKLEGLSPTIQPMTSEQAVFEFVGLKYKEPWERDQFEVMHAAVNAAQEVKP